MELGAWSFWVQERFATFELIRSSYSVMEESDSRMRSLACFFTDDVGPFVEDWIEFLDDVEEESSCADWSVLYKDAGGENIRMLSQYLEGSYAPYPVPDDKITFIKSSELRKLLYQWQELRSRDPRPPKIRITERRGVFNMEEMK